MGIAAQTVAYLGFPLHSQFGPRFPTPPDIIRPSLASNIKELPPHPRTPTSTTHPHPRTPTPTHELPPPPRNSHPHPRTPTSTHFTHELPPPPTPPTNSENTHLHPLHPRTPTSTHFTHELLPLTHEPNSPIIYENPPLPHP
ncbi:hypothetical protein Pcinc_037309 [Petrolisthes cinctipes]|uniref:Uncharacterized protein n=1 Tax=Petrolisthes cinctipes TaxID=88211 RepID=A0AAE1ELI1_PETCI|nr:hypothetical protein Pcinc_037309 [Petrolisthes cinctipes]